MDQDLGSTRVSGRRLLKLSETSLRERVATEQSMIDSRSFLAQHNKPNQVVDLTNTKLDIATVVDRAGS